MARRAGKTVAGLGLGAICSAALLPGCRWHGAQSTIAPPPHHAPPASAAPATTTAASTASGPTFASWSNLGKGIQKLRYPGQWQPKQSADYELMLLPAGAKGDGRRITLDVPDLPPHLPFMLSMNRIQRNYLDDLKKNHPDLRTEDAVDDRIPASTARLVRSSWHQGPQRYDDVALLIVHGNSVYILDAQTDQPHLAATRAAFDAIRSSLQWK